MEMLWKLRRMNCMEQTCQTQDEDSLRNDRGPFHGTMQNQQQTNARRGPADREQTLCTCNPKPQNPGIAMLTALVNRTVPHVTFQRPLAKAKHRPHGGSGTLLPSLPSQIQGLSVIVSPQGLANSASLLSLYYRGHRLHIRYYQGFRSILF